MPPDGAMSARDGSPNRIETKRFKHVVDSKLKWCGLFLVIWLLLFPQLVFANSPGPATHFTIKMEHVPVNAAGVDVLAPVSEIPADSFLEEKTGELAKAGLAADCELATYDDGFVSCLAHYKDVEYDLTFERDAQGGASVRIGGYFGNGQRLFPVLREMSQLKLAVYDKNGDILTVSDAFTTASTFRYVFYGSLAYDAESGHVDVKMNESYTYAIIVALMPFILGISAVGTVLIEIVVGVACAMRPLSTIVKVTALTNIGMNLLFFAMMVMMPSVRPITMLVILEIIVVAIEYHIYRKKYPQHGKKHVLKYSVIANFASAAIGLAVFSSI